MAVIMSFLKFYSSQFKTYTSNWDDLIIILSMLVESQNTFWKQKVDKSNKSNNQ
jgi:hypothetical protein